MGHYVILSQARRCFWPKKKDKKPVSSWIKVELKSYCSFYGRHWKIQKNYTPGLTEKNRSEIECKLLKVLRPFSPSIENFLLREGASKAFHSKSFQNLTVCGYYLLFTNFFWTLWNFSTHLDSTLCYALQKNNFLSLFFESILTTFSSPP